MDKKSSKSKDKSMCQSSERLIDRIFHHFKFSKRPSSSSIIHEEPLRHLKYESRMPIPRLTADDEQSNEPEYERLTPDDLEAFAEKLGKFLQYVQGIQELSYSVYKYPSELQARLEKDANELDSIYREVRAASLKAKRVKKQRKAVRKELTSARRTLDKLLNEETQELEALLQIYDKPMSTRWENLKNTRKPDLLKNLQFDVISKQDALEGLTTLIQQKIANQKPLVPLFDFSKRSKENQNSTVPVFEFSSTRPKENVESSEATFSHRRSSNGPQRPCRRRRASLTRINGEKVAFGTSPDVTTITVVPFSPPAITVTPASSPSDRSLDSSSSGSVSAITPPARDSNSNIHTGVGFASEMQSVLQALFNGMRREDSDANAIETITVDDDSPNGSITSTNANDQNDADENDANADNANENNVMQLFSINPDSEDPDPNV